MTRESRPTIPARPSWRSSLPAPALIGAAAAVNLAVSFGYHWLPVVKLGVGSATDALFVSTLVPQVVLSVVSTSLTSVLTPLLSTASAEAFRTHAWTFGQGVGVGALALSLTLMGSAGAWVPWMAPGFAPDVQALTVSLVRIQLIGAFFTMLLTVTWSAAYARDRFLWVEVSGALASAIGLTVAWLGMGIYGVHAVAWALTLRAALQVALLGSVLGSYARPAWQVVGGAKVWQRLAPLLGGSLYYKADPVVERILASFALPGHLSLFHLAQQVYAAGNQVLTRALINPVMPRLARHAAAADWTAFTAVIRTRLVACTVLFITAWLTVLLAGRPVLAVAASQWLSADQIVLLHALLVLLVGVWLGGAAGQIFTVAFYAFGNTTTPTRVGVVAFTLAIPLKIVAYWYGGILGLAVATSLYTIGAAVAHLVLLRTHVRRCRVLAP